MIKHYGLIYDSLTIDANRNLWAYTNDSKTLVKFDTPNSVNLTINKRFPIPEKNENASCAVMTMFYNNLAVV